MDDGDHYQGAVTLVWEESDEPRPDGVDAAVIEDIRQSLWGLSAPGDLITHHVKLSDDWDGPSVLVWGEEDSDAFHCVYQSTTKWVTASGERI
jgi:hypothetical protein